MKVSLIIPVLNSHEVVRRHLLHWHRCNLPDGFEIILVDDGSDPPLDREFGAHQSKWQPPCEHFRIIETHDTRPWTWALARNAGARIARGEYLLMMDLDYVILQDTIDAVMAFREDKMRFKREFGILDEQGRFTQDVDTLRKYGLMESRIEERGVQLPPHPNNFCMRRSIYEELGGYREDMCEREYPQREDGEFKKRWVELMQTGKVKDTEARPTIYMFPNGQFCGDVDHNPFDLFHDLTRKTNKNPWHQKLLQGGQR